MKPEIFKSYDIRGIYKKEMDEYDAGRIGHAFVDFVGHGKYCVGHDARTMAPSVYRSFIEGMQAAGAAVVELGMCHTPLTYFATGTLNLTGGAMITASHNPPEYIGIKLCREQAIPIGGETGLKTIQDLAMNAKMPKLAGSSEKFDAVEKYRDRIQQFFQKDCKFKVAIDFANGSAGPVFKRAFDGTGLRYDAQCFEPNGNFPNHEPDPLKDSNTRDIVATLKKGGYDFGAAFDGDGDRCIFFDESGRRIGGDIAGALIAKHLPPAKIIGDVRASRVLKEVVESNGGTFLRERVGHAFIKRRMRQEDALFAAELSGHYYFKDNFYADDGIIAFTFFCNALLQDGRKASECASGFQKYSQSGETNFEVHDKKAALETLKAEFSDGAQNELDGLTVEYSDWWFNCRPSNTEPLLRLNIEAATSTLLKEKLARISSLVTRT